MVSSSVSDDNESFRYKNRHGQLSRLYQQTLHTRNSSFVPSSVYIHSTVARTKTLRLATSSDFVPPPLLVHTMVGIINFRLGLIRHIFFVKRCYAI